MMEESAARFARAAAGVRRSPASVPVVAAVRLQGLGPCMGLAIISPGTCVRRCGLWSPHWPAQHPPQLQKLPQAMLMMFLTITKIIRRIAQITPICQRFMSGATSCMQTPTIRCCSHCLYASKDSNLFSFGSLKTSAGSLPC